METLAPANPESGPAARRPRRCSADYRWTLPKVTAFLKSLAQCGSLAEAARSVGMSRQSAYRLRARLAGTPFEAAFAAARKAGIHARFAASQARLRSPWEGPGIAAIVAQQRAAAASAQGDASCPQGNAFGAQGDAASAQGDADPGKVTKHALDSVTTGPGLAVADAIRRSGKGVLHGTC